MVVYHSGVDPDLLVFGKHFTTNVRVLPHMSSSRLNVSEPLTSDKRHFNHPPVRSVSPASTTPHHTTGALSSTHNIQNHLTPCTTQPPSQHIILSSSLSKTDLTSHSKPQTTQPPSQHIVLTSLLPKTDSMSHTSLSTADDRTSQHIILTSSLPAFQSQPHTTRPPKTEQLQSTINEKIFYSTTTVPSSTTPSILTTDAQSSSPSRTSTTQTDTPRSGTITETTNPETTPSTTDRRPPPVTSRAPSSSNSFTTLTSPTALQTTTSASPTTLHTTVSSRTISTSTRRVTLNSTRDPTSDSTTGSGADSQPYPNDTKGYVSRNVSADDVPRPGGSLTSVWRLAANTVLVVLGTCASVTLGCCCSVFAALSWRGRRRRKGRYRTNLSGKRGSMKLIKYVIVRESS